MDSVDFCELIEHKTCQKTVDKAVKKKEKRQNLPLLLKISSL